jgi:hypothetical protein
MTLVNLTDWPDSMLHGVEEKAKVGPEALLIDRYFEVGMSIQSTLPRRLKGRTLALWTLRVSSELPQLVP